MAFAAVFPGQGSQSVGMLSELAAHNDAVRRTFGEASEALGFDLARLIAEGPAEDLDRTENTQPALLAAGVAAWRAWQAAGGPRPVAMAGHSLGEYTALVAAGALDFDAALRLVRLRGRYMQEAVPAGEGGMAAVLGLDADEVGRLCADAAGDGLAAPANINAPGQVVIAGDRKAVEAVARLAEEAGAKKIVMLSVSAPSHCALMRPAAERLAEDLADIELRRPELPVVNNAEVAAPDEPGAIRDALVSQLTSPVRWVEVVRSLKHDYGAERLAEMGPGRVLSGLTRRIDRSMKALPVNDPASLEAAIEALS